MNGLEVTTVDFLPIRIEISSEPVREILENVFSKAYNRSADCSEEERVVLSVRDALRNLGPHVT